MSAPLEFCVCIQCFIIQYTAKDKADIP